MATIARITDGTTTVNLIWDNRTNPNYLLSRDGWAPAVAPLSLSDLGGGGTYDPVDEEIELYVCGVSESNVLANLDALNTLLDQAERFWRLNQVVSAVKLYFMPNGGASVLSCLIRGRAKGDESAGLSLDVHALKGISEFAVKVRVRLARNGLLLANSETATTSSVSIGDLYTRTMPSTVAHHSPMDVKFSGFGDHDDDPMVLPDMYFLFGPGSTSFAIQEAEAMTATGYTSRADGNNCRGAAVLRYTPTGTTLVPSGQSSAITMPGRVLAFFATLRNDSASASFDINIALPTAGGTLRTTPVTIDTSSQNPRAVALGIVVLPSASLTTAFFVEIAASSATGPPHLDIDVIYVLCMDDESSSVVVVPSQTIGTGTTADLLFDMEVDIESQVLTATQPTVKLRDSLSSGVGAIPYDYDPFLMSKGNTVCAIIVAPGGPGAATSWRYSNGGVVTPTMRVTRYPAYPCPR